MKKPEIPLMSISKFLQEQSQQLKQEWVKPEETYLYQLTLSSVLNYYQNFMNFQRLLNTAISKI